MKHTPAIYPIHDLIRNRWSPRAFAAKAVPQEALNQIFEAASWAFSAMNEQPWRYIYAHREDTEAFNKILNCLLPGNQPWAKNAPVLVISLVKTHFDNGTLNRTAMHDVGAANATLFLEATSLGIYGHVMGGFDAERTKQEFDLPEGYEPVVVFALGYLGEADQLEEPFRTRELGERKRKSLSEFAFQNELTNLQPVSQNA
jgi:nitroreductase